MTNAHTTERPAAADRAAEIRPFGGRNYSRNSDRAGRYDSCAYCGKAVKSPRWWVEVGGGGYFFFGPATPNPDEKRSDAGYMGCYPVGRDCADLLRSAGVTVTDGSKHDGESHAEPTYDNEVI